MKIKKSTVTDIALIVIVLLFAAWCLHLDSPPQPAAEDTPLTEFSSHRAMEHVRAMCVKPHSMGTDEHRRVREYIVAEADKMGLETEVQTASVVRPNGTCATVHNVIATLKGTGGAGKSIMIAAHYDTQPHTPGAADDGAATAAMLESARALKLPGSRKNDIIFLFTDGEEIGMLGADAFANQHPAAKKVGLVLNLEARGNTGSSYTFEVSADNGTIMKEYADAVPYPIAGSIMYEIYKNMSNNTDFTIFKDAGMPGYNASFIGGFVNYHSMTDSPENLDQGSLQHHGSTIMGICRHFANHPLDKLESPDSIFFNPMGTWFVHYPGWLSIVLLVAVYLLFSAYMVLGIKKKCLTFKGIIGGIFLYLAAFVLVGGFTWLLQLIIPLSYPHYTHFYGNNFYNASYYFAAAQAAAIAIIAGMYALLSRKTNPANLFAGAAAVLLLCTTALYMTMQTATYLLTIPLLFVTGAALLSLRRKVTIGPDGVLQSVLKLAGALPAVALIVPLIPAFFVAFGPVFLLPGTLATVILMGFLLPQLEAGNRLHRAAIPSVALVIALIAFIGGHFTSQPNETQPLQSNVMYCLDADTQHALWVSRHLAADDWNRQFFSEPKKEALTEIYPYAQRIRLKNNAPPASIPLPELAVLEDYSADGRRHLKSRVTSPQNATIVQFLIKKGPGISKLLIGGEPVTVEKEPGKSGFKYYYVEYFAFPPEGIDLELECDEGKDIEILVVEKKLGLPAFPRYKPLAPGFIPDTDDESHVTLLKKTFVL
ncbi:MAG: M20/M25/M40 family metallo-hydrolase [bacterium]|nr:M20/M25/M40 family metallo-hydrolase [bacterium]